MSPPLLRNVRPAALPADYRALLDEDAPLPAGTELLATRRPVRAWVMTGAAWIAAAWAFAKLAALTKELYVEGPVDPGCGYMFGLDFVGTLVLAALAAMIGAWTSITSVRETWKALRLRRGRFRRGVFVTHDAVLVRLEDESCSLVPRARLRSRPDAEHNVIRVASEARLEATTYRGAPTAEHEEEDVPLDSPDAPAVGDVWRAIERHDA